MTGLSAMDTGVGGTVFPIEGQRSMYMSGLFIAWLPIAFVPQLLPALVVHAQNSPMPFFAATAVAVYSPSQNLTRGPLVPQLQ